MTSGKRSSDREASASNSPAGRDLDTVLVPVGGGGLIAGIAAYFASAVRVIGVEPDGAPTLTRARARGGPVDAPTGSIAADVLAPRRVGDLVFPLTRSFVSDVLLVDDKAIRQAQNALWRTTRLITEPAAAATTAAMITGAYRPTPGERVAIVITGANITLSDFQSPATVLNEPHRRLGRNLTGCRKIAGRVLPITQALHRGVRSWSMTTSVARSAPCGRRRASWPSRPPRSAPRPAHQARASPRPASASPSSSPAPNIESTRRRRLKSGYG